MIKEKLQRGTLIYKLYLYYQLFFRYKLFYKKKNYSQFDEDLFLINFFKNKKNGKFVDLGAFHPIRYNNTYMLYKRGWSGTNIDLNPTAIDMFNIVRNKDINKCALVSKQSNIDKTVYYEHNFSPVNSLILSKELKKVIREKKTMKTKTFDDLIDHKFDFLNIDLEGHDYEVLQTINLEKHKPSLICIEILESSKDKENIFKYMEKNSFKLKKICKVSYFFENNN
jgi:hypothetical protein|tara:strand:+ start:4980 stop:5654 length:675 start_codon:yes stop_codon:yes gene_type:complete